MECKIRNYVLLLVFSFLITQCGWAKYQKTSLKSSANTNSQGNGDFSATGESDDPTSSRKTVKLNMHLSFENAVGEVVVSEGTYLLIHFSLNNPALLESHFHLDLANQIKSNQLSTYLAIDFFELRNTEITIPKGETSGSLILRPIKKYFFHPDTEWFLSFVSQNSEIESKDQLKFTLLSNDSNHLPISVPTPLPEPILNPEPVNPPLPNLAEFLQTLPELQSLSWYWSMTGAGQLKVNQPITIDYGLPVFFNNLATSGSLPVQLMSYAYSPILSPLNSSAILSNAKSGQYISCGKLPGFTDLRNSTYAVWLRINPDNVNGTIFDSIPTSGTIPSGILIETSSIKGKVGIVLDQSEFPSLKYTNEVPADGTWFHLVITWNGTMGAHGIAIYINGSPVNSYSTSVDGLGDHILNFNSTFTIGGKANGQDSFSGEMDEFGLWRTDLSSSQILLLSNSQRPQ